MHKALIFLSELRRLVPPDVGNHGLLLGSEGLFVCVVRHHRIGQSFTFDAADLERDPVELAIEIAGIIERNFASERKTA
jgi:hypothetical protein